MFRACADRAICDLIRAMDEERLLPLSAALSDLTSAVFNGAPTPEAAEKYTAQLTALISLYICFVAIFLLGVYIRAVNRDAHLTAERKTFNTWIAMSFVFAILMIAAFLVYFFNSAG
jgi:heme/copper-type cytochrome/quinol oxidase subunit 1